VFTLTRFSVKSRPGEAARIELHQQLPNPFVLYTDGGSVATFLLLEEQATCDLGNSSLTVRATPGREVYLVPEEHRENPVVLRVANLFPRRVGEGGETTFDPLPAGRYVIGVRGKGLGRTVAVNGGATSVRIE